MKKVHRKLLVQNRISLQISSLLIAKIFSIFLTYALSILILKKLGLKEFGNFSAILLWASILGSLSSIGFLNFFIKYCAHEHSSKSTENYLAWGFRVCITLSVIAFLLFVLLVYFSGKAEIDGIFIFGIIVFFSSIGDFLSHYLVSISKAGHGMFLVSCMRLLIIFALTISTENLTVATILGYYFFGYLTSCIAIICYVRLGEKQYLFAFNNASKSSSIKNALTFFYFNGISAWLASGLVFFIVTLFSSATEIGVYRISDLILLAAGMPVAILTLVFAPILSDLAASKKINEISRKGSQLAQVCFSIVLFFLVLFLFLGDYFLAKFLFSDPNLFPVSLVLLIGLLGNAFFGPNAVCLNILGYEKHVLRTHLVAIAWLFAGCFFLVLNEAPILYFAALSTSSVLLWNVLLDSKIRRLQGFSVSAFGNFC